MLFNCYSWGVSEVVWSCDVTGMVWGCDVSVVDWGWGVSVFDDWFTFNFDVFDDRCSFNNDFVWDWVWDWFVNIDGVAVEGDFWGIVDDVGFEGGGDSDTWGVNLGFVDD